jgi:hypothetical protein
MHLGRNLPWMRSEASRAWTSLSGRCHSCAARAASMVGANDAAIRELQCQRAQSKSFALTCSPESTCCRIPDPGSRIPDPRSREAGLAGHHIYRFVTLRQITARTLPCGGSTECGSGSAGGSRSLDPSAAFRVAAVAEVAAIIYRSIVPAACSQFGSQCQSEHLQTNSEANQYQACFLRNNWSTDDPI